MNERTAERVLVVEDDPALASLTAEFLASHGFVVQCEPRGDAAIERILQDRPDVVLLDLNLPGRSGFDVCRAVRARWDGVLVVLTARRDEVDEVVALELGADDYMMKPIRTRALLTRVQGLLRRSGASVDERRLVVGPLVIDGRTRTATLDKQPLELSTAEFELLWLLANRRDEVVARDDLYRQLRGFEWDGLDRSIDLRVSRLRRKLGDDGKRPSLLRSVRGEGYLLAAAELAK